MDAIKTQNKLCVNVDEMARRLNVSRRVGFELAHRDDFPKIRIGRRILIPIAGLERWVEAQSGNVSTDQHVG